MNDLPLIKILQSNANDRNHFLSAFATDLLLTQALDYDGSGNLIYQGFALPGTGKGASQWLIKKITYNASNQATDIQFANGVIAFDQIWNNRVSLSYA